MDVFFRVDAGQAVGSGHLMRCRVLARALREEGVQPSFITSTPPNSLVREVQREGFALLSLPQEKAVDASSIVHLVESQSHDRSLVVLDDHRVGFHSLEFQRELRDAHRKLMMISFRHKPHFLADIVHNQNLLAEEYDYSVEDHTTLLRGPKYAILADAYRRLRPERPEVPERVRTVLVTFGGGDHTNQTQKIIDGLSGNSVDFRCLVVVAGAMHSSPEGLKSQLDSLSRLDTELHLNVTNSKMAKLMARADMVISSGGLTVWEVACLSVPNVIVSTTEEQRQTAELLHEREFACYLGHHDEVSVDEVTECVDFLSSAWSRREKLARRSWELVDGKGTERVVQNIQELISRDKAPGFR